MNLSPTVLCLQCIAAGILGNAIGLTLLGLFLYVILLCSKYYWLVLVYQFWCWFDYKTCETGSRRSIRFRNWVFWKHLKDYFPIKLIKTVNLDINKNYIFAVYPHGFIPLGPTCNFGCEATDFKKLFPGFIPHILSSSFLFFIPFIREVLIAVGSCVPTNKTLGNILNDENSGRIAVLMPGGVKEGSLAKKDRYKIILKSRRGFIRLALKYGSPLVPVISFGENDAYDNFVDPDSPIAEWILNNIARPLKICLNFPRGRFFWLPHRTPITTIVGSPIMVEKINDPTEEDISKVQEQFMKALIEMFEREKYNYLEDPDNTKLEII